MRSAEAKRFEVMKTTDRGSAHLPTPDSHQALCIRVEKFYLVEFARILGLEIRSTIDAIPTAYTNGMHNPRVSNTSASCRCLPFG